MRRGEERRGEEERGEERRGEESIGVKAEYHSCIERVKKRQINDKVSFN